MPAASKTYAIHPAIGIARMGDAALDPANRATYYLGPEAPYEVPNQGLPYKTGGRMKKQAQRFRIYEYENGVAVREITLASPDVETIAWTVHLSNRKAALDPNRPDCPYSTPSVQPETYVPAKARNVTRNNSNDFPRRNLVIDPGARRIEARKNGKAQAARALADTIDFGAGTQTAEVALGTIFIEHDTGRLLVFAADGVSQGLDENGVFSDSASFGSAPDKEMWQYANSDGWYDDSADGRVTACISFSDGTTVDLAQPEQAAWVICTLPRYVPGIGYFTTLYDVAIDALAGPEDRDRRPSFMKDIYPVLSSVSRLHWVNLSAAQGHSRGKGDYLAPTMMKLLADSDPDHSSIAWKRRNAIFARLRQPGSPDRNENLMPRVARDVLEDVQEPYDIAALTALQYALMKKWRDGYFESDFDSGDQYVPLDDVEIAEQPAALDRGALEGTAGTPLYPGIESWRIMREPRIYAAPLRLSGKMQPGDLTMGNALPWQADFLDCTDTWWPVQRPTDVLRNGSLAGWVPSGWREYDDTPEFRQMVRHWSGLGLVVSADRGTTFAEDERSLEG